MSHAAPRRFPAEHHVRELARLLAIPAIAARMRSAPAVSGEFDVPDLAGYSTDGAMVYVDRHAAGKLDPRDRDALVEHEHVEKTLIDVLGYSYAAAHEMATCAEHEKVEDAAAYEKRVQPLVKRSELERVEKPPPDLDCHPYYEDPDAQDLKILARLAELGVRDALQPQVKLSHDIVKYGPGHRPEYCERCAHYDKRLLVVNKAIDSKPRCHLVQDPIDSRGWCRLWQKK